MRCPLCQTGDSRVIDSRELPGGAAIRRRRECVNCRGRFTTYERVDAVSLVVIKKDGRREAYDPDKLRRKLRVALTKRPIGEPEIDALLGRVEATLLALGTTEVDSARVGETVLSELKQLDQVAYIRFASVYREFGDLEDLRRELEGLAGGAHLPDANAP